MKVFGIDIVRGSVRSRSKRPMYALVRTEDGAVFSEGEVSGFRLFRLLSEEEPDILAVDSLQEIAADQREIFSFLQRLPPATRLVQVTGGERKESLGKVAGRYNISFNKFDPFAEARTIAQVAALGAGAEVIAFENTTGIVVSRHRSPGKGGWSQNRYARKIHGAVQLKAREIEMELLAAGLRYEKKETRAFGGCSRVAFHVHAVRDQIPAHTYRGADVQVRIEGKRLDRIRFRPLTGKPRYLIVGIDPGTTTAVAAMDLDGNLLHLSSSRQTTMSGVIEALYRVGKPLIIASDVQEMPFTVEKIRRAFNAIAYSPKLDISVETKMEITRPYQYANDHERDALAAALSAYRQHQAKFQNLVKRVPPGNDLDEVRARVIRGQSLEQVLYEMRGKPVLVREGVSRQPVGPPLQAAPGDEAAAVSRHDDRVRVLDGTVKRLREYVGELQTQLQEKEYEITRLHARIRKVRSAREGVLMKDTEIAKRDTVIQSLKQRLRKEERHTRSLARRLGRMREAEEMELSGEGVPLKVLDSLTRDALRRLDEYIGVAKGDTIYLARADGWGRSLVKELADRGVKAVIAPDAVLEQADPQMQLAFLELRLPLLGSEESGARVRGKQGIADPDRLEEALKAWSGRLGQHEREKKAAMVEHLFMEYKTERGKEVRRSG
jgi:predicted RNase H-like nuclease (RuvC/YqgF family)